MQRVLTLSNHTVLFGYNPLSPSHVALMWVQSVKLTSQKVFIANLQTVEVKLKRVDERYPSRFSAYLVHVAAPHIAWMGSCQMGLFTRLWIMKRMQSLDEEIDTVEAVAWIFKF